MTGLGFLIRSVIQWFWGTEIRNLDVDVRFSLLGKRMRALSDDLDLAETAGIDTRRVILYDG